jgi:hypothetical protein
MFREPLLLPCAPALLAADTLLLGAANADNYDTCEERTASPAAARQSAEVADPVPPNEAGPRTHIYMCDAGATEASARRNDAR